MEWSTMKVKTKFNKIKKWEIQSEEVEYETPIFTLLKRDCRSANQDKQHGFYIIKAPDWINIVPVTSNGEIVLVKQYRHGIHELTWEIPGGAVDSDDGDPMIAAKRELAEETGFTSDHWESLGSVSSNPAIFTNECHFYIAWDCELTSDQNLDPFEEIEVKTVPVKEFLQQVSEGEIHHSLIVAAVAKLLLQHPELMS